MATIADGARARDQAEAGSVGGLLFKAMSMLGSLKLTVALFAASLVIVLVGTLAQDEMNMLEVKERYFLSWFTFLYVDDFLPQAFVPHEQPITLKIPFVGGAFIGAALMINLIFAKATRFHVRARGGQLFAGLAFLFVGALVTLGVVIAGHNGEGLQGNPPISYGSLWNCIIVALIGLTVGLTIAAARSSRTVFAILYLLVALLAAGLVGYSLIGSWRVGDPGLRIIWQLTQGLGAGLILLVGCRLLFDKQGGNVLLHMGVALLMFGQFQFGDYQDERRFSLVEGESTNLFVNFDEVELAFVRTEEGKQTVIGLPVSRMASAARSEEVIRDDKLPVDVRVLEYFKNSQLKDVGPDNPATVGWGLETGVKNASSSGGASSEQNLTSAYVELLDKESGESLGTHLVSHFISEQKLLFEGPNVQDRYDSVNVGDQSYEVGLRFRREVKPYWVQLRDVQRVSYTGSEMTRDYSSFIRIVDSESGEEFRERVWMNNPLRYRGETFYQSTYRQLRSGQELTGIQVVSNPGWLIPYVACSITALGMFVHFLGTLTRFVDRRERDYRKRVAATGQFAAPTDREGGVSRVAAVGSAMAYAAVPLFAIAVLYMLVPWSAVYHSMRPKSRDADFDLYEFGKIPTQFGGRMMPLDAYARQTLKLMTNKESLPLDDAPLHFEKRAGDDRMSAIQWLLEVAVNDPNVDKLHMFRIDAEEVRSELGLNRRKSKLYSLAELRDKWIALEPRIAEIRRRAERGDKDLSFKEKKLLELSSRISAFTRTKASFEISTPPNFSPQDEAQIREMRVAMERIEKTVPWPAIVPPTREDAEDAAASTDMPDWLTFGPALLREEADRFLLGEDEFVPLGGVKTFSEMLVAYSEEDSVAFNKALDAHLVAVHEYPVPRYSRSVVSLERWMESNDPTFVATLVYLAAVVLCLGYFLVNLPQLRESIWITLALALLIHSVAIGCRIAITGRAPVINIYSSAVFIGWGSVVAGLIVERVFRNGMGNILAASMGMLTLLVAYGLNLTTGDTMPVLEAVLDTQFWLATHVISVTLGYVATMAAGFLGICYLISGWAGMRKGQLQDLYRACYGAACFGVLFSFVGTVLGGLWADDSWGRFWGWDPKENGALLIVIWNALVLHARWDGMVKGRGFAVLAIGGNIVTAWSWFGTNELGIGLHSYGFTEGVLLYLSMFVMSQVAFVLAGMFFWSEPPDDVKV